MKNNIFRLRKQMEMIKGYPVPLRLLAEHCGISLTCAKAWEHQRWNPKGEHMIKAAEFFNVPVESILDRE